MVSALNVNKHLNPVDGKIDALSNLSQSAKGKKITTKSNSNMVSDKSIDLSWLFANGLMKKMEKCQQQTKCKKP